MKQNKKTKPEKAANILKHEALCKICQHESRPEIEAEFLNWHSPVKIAKDYGLTRAGIYRHASALGLFSKRRKNVRRVLERILEQVDGVWQISAGAIVQAAVALSKINSEGKYVERRETIDMNQLFERMSAQELTEYAESGKLPAWFTDLVGQPETADEVLDD